MIRSAITLLSHLTACVAGGTVYVYLVNSTRTLLEAVGLVVGTTLGMALVACGGVELARWRRVRREKSYRDRGAGI